MHWYKPSSQVKVGRLFFAIIGLRLATVAWSASPLEELAAADSPLRAGDVLAFHGDYLTEVADRPGGYADLLKQAIYAQRPELGIRVVTAGDSGYRSTSLAGDIQAQLITQQPTVVFILIGNHDVGTAATATNGLTPPAVYEQALRQEITTIREAGALPVLATPTVIGEKTGGGNPRDALLDAYAARSRSVAAELGVELCDLRAAFVAYLQTHNPANLDKGVLTVDGIYLSPAGNRLVAECAATSICHALRAAPWFIPCRDHLILAQTPVELRGRGIDNRDLDIRYTLDGTPPTDASPRYQHPLQFTQPTCLSIRVRDIPTGHRYTSRALITPATLRQPEHPANLRPGLTYWLYDYDATASQQLPDFTKLTPVQRGPLNTPFFFPEKRQEVLALQMRAWIDILRDGIYTFYSRSYFANRLLIGETPVVEHPFTNHKLTCGGQIALAAGKHAIRMEYCRLKKGDVSQWFYYAGPGIYMQMIPETVLFR